MVSVLAAANAFQPPETPCALAILNRVSPALTVYSPSAALPEAAGWLLPLD